MPVGRRRELYAERYEALVNGLGGGALPLDERAASEAARIAAASRAAGASLDDHLFDVLIAGTASVHGLTVVTRNERQFRATGCRSSTRGAADPARLGASAHPD